MSTWTKHIGEMAAGSKRPAWKRGTRGPLQPPQVEAMPAMVPQTPRGRP